MMSASAIARCASPDVVLVVGVAVVGPAELPAEDPLAAQPTIKTATVENEISEDRRMSRRGAAHVPNALGRETTAAGRSTEPAQPKKHDATVAVFFAEASASDQAGHQRDADQREQHGGDPLGQLRV